MATDLRRCPPASKAFATGQGERKEIVGRGAYPAATSWACLLLSVSLRLDSRVPPSWRRSPAACRRIPFYSPGAVRFRSDRLQAHGGLGGDIDYSFKKKWTS